MRCSNCGLEKEVTTQDLILAMMVEFGGARTNADFRRCRCSPNVKPPHYWKANEITEEEAEEMGEIEYKVWRLHHSPPMRDCVTLDYGYRVKNGKVIVEAQGEYYDITEEVLESRV